MSAEREAQRRIAVEAVADQPDGVTRLDHVAAVLGQHGYPMGPAGAKKLLTECYSRGLLARPSPGRPRRADPLRSAMDLISELVQHEDTCDLNGRGYCLEHGFESPCRVETAKAMVADYRTWSQT